jgi:hypothetical protein
MRTGGGVVGGGGSRLKKICFESWITIPANFQKFLQIQHILTNGLWTGRILTNPVKNSHKSGFADTIQWATCPLANIHWH